MHDASLWYHRWQQLAIAQIRKEFQSLEVNWVKDLYDQWDENMGYIYMCVCVCVCLCVCVCVCWYIYIYIYIYKRIPFIYQMWSCRVTNNLNKLLNRLYAYPLNSKSLHNHRYLPFYIKIIHNQPTVKKSFTH